MKNIFYKLNFLNITYFQYNMKKKNKKNNCNNIKLNYKKIDIFKSN